MRLFIELYLDEDVSVLLADLLKGRDFEAITARNLSMLGKSDKQHLEYAISQQRTLLTHNRLDYENLFGEYAEKEKHHFGIIIATRRNVYAILERLLSTLDKVTADEMENGIRYI